MRWKNWLTTSLLQLFTSRMVLQPIMHSSSYVWNLHERYPDRWIWTNEPTRWPARSPDLTPIDFFIWSHVKNVVYNIHPPQSIQDLTERIVGAFENIDKRLLGKATKGLRKRCEICIEEMAYITNSFCK